MKKLTTVLSFCTASVMLAAALCGCGGASGGNSSLTAEKAYAEKQLSGFVSGQNAATFAFSDEAYSKANVAAMLFNADSSEENVQKIVRNLSLDSLTVTDEKGVVVASYPEGDAGKNIKELGDKAIFNKIVKGVSDKLMNDPVYDADADTYEVLAGVRRGDAGGVVVVGYQDAGYANITGGSLAQACGVNTVALQKGVVISSTLDGIAKEAKLEDLGVKEEDLSKESFTVTAGDKKYTAMAVQNGDFVIIAAVPA